MIFFSLENLTEKPPVLLAANNSNVGENSRQCGDGAGAHLSFN
jgi:hypothetical protein